LALPLVLEEEDEDEDEGFLLLLMLLRECMGNCAGGGIVCRGEAGRPGRG
jgi:hypothetical protein